MTCIAAILDGPKIIMCADSAVSYGDTQIQRANSKILAFDEFVVGAAGRTRVLDVVLYEHRPEKPEANATPGSFELDAYMSKVFCNTLREKLSDLDVLGKNEDDEAASIGNTSILVGIRRSIYFIDSELACHRLAHPFFAIGSGADLAVGSLATTADQSMPIGERLLTAMNIAAKFSETVCPPFTFVSTPE